MQEIPKSFYSKSTNMMVLRSGSHWSMLINGWGIKDWAFYKVTPSYFPVSVNERPEDCNEEMNRWCDMWICVWNVLVAFFIFTGSLESLGWIFLQNGKWWLFNLFPQDKGIKYKSEVLFELCTPLLQLTLRTKKNSEMFYQDQYL